MVFYFSRTFVQIVLDFDRIKKTQAFCQADITLQVETQTLKFSK